MHVEQNVCDSLLKHLFGERDMVEVRKDMEKASVQKHLWLWRRLGTTIFFKPPAPLCSHKKKINLFFDFVSNIQVLIRYLVAFKKHVGPKRLFAMKSHDHHVMLQQILLVRVWVLLQPRLRTTIIRLGRTFGKIYAKVINPLKLFNLRTYVAETLCLLEV
jgi:hypothetical protein